MSYPGVHMLGAGRIVLDDEKFNLAVVDLGEGSEDDTMSDRTSGRRLPGYYWLLLEFLSLLRAHGMASVGTVILRAACAAAVYGRTRLHLRILEQLLAAAIGGGTGFVRDGLLFTQTWCAVVALVFAGSVKIRQGNDTVFAFCASSHLKTFFCRGRYGAVVTGVSDFIQDKTKT